MRMETSEPCGLEAVLSRPGSTWSDDEFDLVTSEVVRCPDFRPRELATVVHTLRQSAAWCVDQDFLDALAAFFERWLELRTAHPCVRKYDPCRRKAVTKVLAGFEVYLLGNIRLHTRSWAKKRENEPVGGSDSDREGLEKLPDPGSSEHTAPPDSRVVRTTVAQAILDCLADIEPSQAMAFRLRFLHYLPAGERTRLLDLLLENGCTAINERQLVSRAVQAMRTCLSRKGFEP